MAEITNNSNEIQYSVSLNSNGNFSSDNFIRYGPIRFYRRKGKAPTLSTGRKSKFEQLDGEDYIKRELRREKNRLLSKRLKETRDNIFNELVQQINQLEQNQSHLLDYIQELNLCKKKLSKELENFNEDPIINLINPNGDTLFFEQYDLEDFDTDSLLSVFSDEQSSVEDSISDDSQ